MRIPSQPYWHDKTLLKNKINRKFNIYNCISPPYFINNNLKDTRRLRLNGKSFKSLTKEEPREF